MTHFGNHRRRLAFTMIEFLVAAAMTSLLAVLLASVWSGLGRPMVDAMTAAQIAQEANLAAAALACDFGGTLTDSAGRLGAVGDGKLVGRMQPGGTVLRLCFDGPLADGIAEWGQPDVVISYLVENGALIRWNENDGTTFVAARFVEQIELADQGNGVEIKLTFSHRNRTRTYTFVGLDP